MCDQVFQDEPDVIVAKMDATVANKVPKKYAVRSFPTIKWFPKDQKYGVEYNYERSKKGLVDFLNEKTGSARDMNGGLLPHVGRVKPLDDVVLAMEDDDAGHAALPCLAWSGLAWYGTLRYSAVRNGTI